MFLGKKNKQNKTTINASYDRELVFKESGESGRELGAEGRWGQGGGQTADDKDLDAFGKLSGSVDKTWLVIRNEHSAAWRINWKGSRAFAGISLEAYA